MISRNLESTIINSLSKFPIVGLIGSRQVGKTTLAKEIRKHLPDSIYLDLELPSDMNKLTNPELYLKQYSDTLIILDEIQRIQELFPVMRALIDQNRKAGRFLILGSASPDLLKKSSESLAGRIIYHELSPFIWNELSINSETINKLWLYGGYPLSFLARTLEDSMQWREAFISTYLERDIPQLGIRIPAVQLRKFWNMLAHLHGQIWNASQIANSLGITAPTARNYLEILTDSFIIRQLPAYFKNIKKRLVKSPKVYIRDSGLLHALLGIKTFDDLHAHPVIGRSWEGFVIEQLVNSLPSEWNIFYYRTSAGAEIDLVLTTQFDRFIIVEIKYSEEPRPARGFWNALEDFNCEQGFVIYPGAEKYPLTEKVFVLPFKMLNTIASLSKKE